MTKGLTGIPSLSYLGVNAKQPPNIAMYNRAPTVNDWQNFIVGDIWINIAPTPAIAREVYMLVALLHNQATWLNLFSGTGGNAITNLIDDSGNIIVPLLGAITIQGGANINTDGSVPHIITVNLDTSILQPATTADQSAGVYSLGGIPYLHGYGVANVFAGGAGNFTFNPTFNTGNIGIGNHTLESLSGTAGFEGCFNVAAGQYALRFLTTGTGNTALGGSAGMNLTTGEANFFIGSNAGMFLTTGSDNTLVGQGSGTNYTGNESENIIIGNDTLGVTGESNALRIGQATGSGLAELNKAFICGIYNTAAGIAYLGTNPKMVAIGSDNKITSSPNIYMPATTSTTGQIIVGVVRFFHSFGTSNTFVGGYAGNFTMTVNAANNLGFGGGALTALVGSAPGKGSANIAIGNATLEMATDASNNTAVGQGSGGQLLTGNFNILYGQGSGYNYTSTESNNICIGNPGTIADANTIRIGTSGGGSEQQNKCFIAAIRGITTVNANAIPVLIDSVGQLGTVSSSIRHKENVKDISDISEIVSHLRPVEFNYKQHKSTDIQYGLIAEEVAPVWPEMLVYDKEGQPETVKYQYLPIILLKEIQNLRKRIEQLEKDRA